MHATKIIASITFISILNTACDFTDQSPGKIARNNLNDTLTLAGKMPEKGIYQGFPADSCFFLKVLRAGNFHDDEVWNNAHEENWLGLFRNQTGFYIAPTRIKTSKVHDMVVDEREDEKTGWKVETAVGDSSIILFEAQNNPKQGQVEEASLSKKELYPGDTIHIRYKAHEYTLYATGNKKKVQDNPEWFELSDYKLHVEATINGHLRKSVLVMKPGFTDRITTIIFAGDIDGDHILDWIIDTSHQDNVSCYTLYLSRPAGKGELVKPAGSHTIVGC